MIAIVRLPLLACAVAALAAGLGAGLARLGWDMPQLSLIHI